MADWTTPKTDWTAEDYFNYGDYNRMVDNLLFLKGLADELFTGLQYSSMTQNKSYLSMIYASDINKISDNLDKLNEISYNLPIGTKMTYSANGTTPLYSDYNRIESATLALYKHLMVTPRVIPHLAFGLGKGVGFPRVKYKTDEEIGYRFSFKLGKERGFK